MAYPLRLRPMAHRWGVLRSAQDRPGQAEEATLRGIIRQGQPGTAMPAWEGRLSEEEIEALIRFLFELSREPSRP